jgi:hypothetical protein
MRRRYVAPATAENVTRESRPAGPHVVPKASLLQAIIEAGPTPHDHES